MSVGDSRTTSTCNTPLSVQPQLPGKTVRRILQSTLFAHEVQTILQNKNTYILEMTFMLFLSSSKLAKVRVANSLLYFNDPRLILASLAFTAEAGQPYTLVLSTYDPAIEGRWYCTVCSLGGPVDVVELTEKRPSTTVKVSYRCCRFG